MKIESKRTGRLWIKGIVSILIAFGLCLPLLRYVDLKTLIDVIGAASLLWIVGAAFAFGWYQWLRTQRFYLLVMPQGSRGLLFGTISIHTFLNGILPAGVGEGAFVYLLKRLHQVSFLRGTSSLLCARLIDLTLFCLLFFVVLFWVRHRLPGPLVWGMVLVVGLLAGVLASLWSAIFSRNWILKKLKIKSYRLYRYFEEFNISWRRMSDKRVLRSLIGYSMAMWLAMYGFFFAVIHALRFELGAEDVLFLYIALFPVSLLPIRGVANLGTHEATWVAVLVALGMSLKEATTLAFSSHILFLSAILVFGLLPSVYMAITWWLRKTSVPLT